MKHKSTLFASTGIPSLFLIFAVLCLAVLSLLTLGTTRSEKSTAQASVSQTENYYSACQNASETLAEIQKSLSECYIKSNNSDIYFTLAAQIPSKIQDTAITCDENAHTFSFQQPFSDSQALMVTVEIQYPDTANDSSTDDSFIKILQWKTDNTDTWNPDTGLSVYKGEQS